VLKFIVKIEIYLPIESKLQDYSINPKDGGDMTWCQENKFKQNGILKKYASLIIYAHNKLW